MKKTTTILSATALVMAVVSAVAIFLCSTVLRDPVIQLFYGSINAEYVPYYIHLPVIICQVLSVLVMLIGFMGTLTKGRSFVTELLALIGLAGLPMVNTVAGYITQTIVNQYGTKFSVVYIYVNNICSFISPIGTAAAALMLFCCGMSIAVKRNTSAMPVFQPELLPKPTKTKKAATIIMVISLAMTALTMILVFAAMLFRVPLAEFMSTPHEVMTYIQSGRALPWDTVFFVFITLVCCVFAFAMFKNGSPAGEIVFVVLIGLLMPIVSFGVSYLFSVVSGRYIGEAMLSARGAMTPVFAIATLPLGLAKTLAYFACGISVGAKRVEKQNRTSAFLQK